MEKLTDQIEGSSCILPRLGVVHYSGFDPTKLSTYEEGKAKEKKLEIHEKACEEEPIVKNENSEVISIENSLERDLKMPQEKVKKYKGVRQRKPGKWVAEVRVLGVDAMTKILKQPPRYTPLTEINYMNPPSSSIDNSRI
ncbi:hypothetical protein FXO37_19367 [Capsicum annuum]|nr:hypothetical protein FXO37_19367 [Capsicum annuum]